MKPDTFAPVAYYDNKSQKVSSIHLPKKSHIAVIGAGAFGGWAALSLLREGYEVTLIDAWGAGNSRASSGDETRVIRYTYGANETYFQMTLRAMSLWKENEQRFGKKLIHNTGVLWFCYQEKESFIELSLPFLEKEGLSYEYLSNQEAQKRYSIINTEDLHHLVFDKDGGYLTARANCQAVAEAFVREGGKYKIQYVEVPTSSQTALHQLKLANGEQIQADCFIFACGPWLGQMFPEIPVSVSKQEAYYFGTPADCASDFEQFPVWVDANWDDLHYGIPSSMQRGFKIAYDRRGESINPTEYERIITQENLQISRDFLAHRFPKMKNAPLAESRVCQYENSPDGNLIFDLHPAWQNVWVLGGGSGHGYKLGPALGEFVAKVFSGQSLNNPLFLLNRLGQ
jgi:glycine/D-amino acid oxidase-like deaminating enzyme